MLEKKRWRAIIKNGSLLFWGNKPILHLLSKLSKNEHCVCPSALFKSKLCFVSQHSTQPWDIILNHSPSKSKVSDRLRREALFLLLLVGASFVGGIFVVYLICWKRILLGEHFDGGISVVHLICWKKKCWRMNVWGGRMCWRMKVWEDEHILPSTLSSSQHILPPTLSSSQHIPALIRLFPIKWGEQQKILRHFGLRQNFLLQMKKRCTGRKGIEICVHCRFCTKLVHCFSLSIFILPATLIWYHVNTQKTKHIIDSLSMKHLFYMTIVKTKGK